MKRMRRRTVNSSSVKYFLLLWAIIILSGCSQSGKLKQAQDLFNEASKLTILDEDYRDYIDELQMIRSDDKLTLPLTEDAKGKYQMMLELLETNVLTSDQLSKELRINAYALKAVAEWRLKQYKDAILTAGQGQQLCVSNGGQNPRDCGMLLIVEGLVANSQTIDQFKKLEQEKPEKNFLKEEAEELVGELEFALEQIGEIDSSYASDEPIVIYANQQKLIIFGNIIDVWSAYSYSKTEAERAEAKKEARGVCEKFPEDYLSRELTQELAKKKFSFDQCGS